MMLPKWARFTMATGMMLVSMSAVGSALFMKINRYAPATTKPYLKIDAPALFVLSIGLTAVALGSIKGHSANQMILQVILACLGFLSLIWLAENKLERPLLYWFEGCFAIFVTVPLAARKLIKSEMARGPRRTWWKRTTEASVFSFLTMLFSLLGTMLQWLAAWAIPEMVK